MFVAAMASLATGTVAGSLSPTPPCARKTRLFFGLPRVARQEWARRTSCFLVGRPSLESQKGVTSLRA